MDQREPLEGNATENPAPSKTVTSCAATVATVGRSSHTQKTATVNLSGAADCNVKSVPTLKNAITASNHLSTPLFIATSSHLYISSHQGYCFCIAILVMWPATF